MAKVMVIAEMATISEDREGGLMKFGVTPGGGGAEGNWERGMSGGMEEEAMVRKTQIQVFQSWIIRECKYSFYRSSPHVCKIARVPDPADDPYIVPETHSGRCHRLDSLHHVTSDHGSAASFESFVSSRIVLM